MIGVCSHQVVVGYATLLIRAKHTDSNCIPSMSTRQPGLQGDNEVHTRRATITILAKNGGNKRATQPLYTVKCERNANF